MRKKSKRKTIFITLILGLNLLLVLVIIRLSSARFQSNATSATKLDVALYAIDATKLASDTSVNIRMADLIPKDNAYTYTFSVSNFNEAGELTDTNITYKLRIITTTNVPLDYYLCYSRRASDLNNCTKSRSVINNNVIAPDADGTYFRTMTIADKNFTYQNKVTDYYKLLVYFPSTYKDYTYQDLIDAIKIEVRSEQQIS